MVKKKSETYIKCILYKIHKWDNSNMSFSV